MIEIIQGNLFDSKADIIAHQVNCRGVMGSGVARQIKERYPKTFEQYNLLCSSSLPRQLLGLAQPCQENDKLIFNLFGQENLGYDGRQYTDTAALYTAFAGLKRYAETHRKTIAIPYKIGCARGGADWENEVFPMIQILFKDTKLEIWKLPEGTNDNEL